MTPWKPGAGPGPWPAMVIVKEVAGGHAYIRGGGPANLWTEDLHPMPPTITLEQQMVLDAAAQQERMFSEQNPIAYGEACCVTINAVRALRAAQQPPDPVKELLAAVRNVQSLARPHFSDDTQALAMSLLDKAIAAVEKAQKS